MRWLAGILAFVLSIAVLCFYRRESYTSVCLNTGETRETRVFGPFKFHETQSTPLSRLLAANGLRNTNNHAWAYANGGGWILGRRRYCGMGNASSLSQFSLNSPDVVSTIRQLIAYTNTAEVEKWLHWAFDPEVAPHLHMSVFDVDQHTNQQDFLTWIQEREIELLEWQAIESNLLREATEKLKSSGASALEYHQ